MSVSLQTGVEYRFEYPRHNFLGVLSKLESRHIRVTAIRDLSEDPIEAVTFEMQPLLKRGRFLVTGQDLDKNAERSFYADSIRGVQVVG